MNCGCEKKSIEVCLLGKTPLFLRYRDTQDDKLERGVFDQFREACLKWDNKETYLYVPSSSIKQAMVEATIISNSLVVYSTAVRHCVFIEGEGKIPVWGIPKVCISKMSNPSRFFVGAAIGMWATRFTVTFAYPMLSESIVGKIINVAGKGCGLGADESSDFGSRNHFEPVNPNNEIFSSVLGRGRERQIAALENPAFFDDESEDFYLETGGLTPCTWNDLSEAVMKHGYKDDIEQTEEVARC